MVNVYNICMKDKLTEKAGNNGLLKKAESVRNRSERTKKHPIFTRVVLRIVTIIVIFILGCGTFWFASRHFSDFFETKSESKAALIDRQLSFCQELVTSKYRYSDIISLKKTSGFAKSYSIIKYSGIIRVGIADFTEISYQINEADNSVKIHLPAAEILGNEIVKQEIFDDKQSIFVPITTQEIMDEINAARIAAAEGMIDEGILRESEEYAKRIIKQFMLGCGFDEVIFI